MTASDVLPPASDAGSGRSQSRTGVLVVVGMVLLGAPVGLLWAAVAPTVEVVLGDGTARLVDPNGDGFIAVDGVFLLLALAAGVVCGAVSWRLVRHPGTGVVVGLVVGGLLAAEVARRTGELVNAGEALAALESGREGVVELSVRLRAEQARLAWPVGGLAAHAVGALYARERSAGRHAVSSG